MEKVSFGYAQEPGYSFIERRNFDYAQFMFHFKLNANESIYVYFGMFRRILLCRKYQRSG